MCYRTVDDVNDAASCREYTLPRAHRDSVVKLWMQKTQGSDQFLMPRLSVIKTNMESKNRFPLHLETTPMSGWSHAEARTATWMTYDTRIQNRLPKDLQKPDTERSKKFVQSDRLLNRDLNAVHLMTTFPFLKENGKTSITSSSTTPTPLTGIRLNPCVTPLWSGPSGHLADPTPNTGYEPNICIDVSSEHTSIHLPSRESSFNLENDATIVASEDFHLPRHSGASSSSRHTAASTVPTLLKLGSVGTSSRKLVADYDSVASQTSSRKLAADVDHETIVPSVLESVSRKKRPRLTRCANTERQTKSPPSSER